MATLADFSIYYQSVESEGTSRTPVTPRVTHATTENRTEQSIQIPIGQRVKREIVNWRVDRGQIGDIIGHPVKKRVGMHLERGSSEL